MHSGSLYCYLAGYMSADPATRAWRNRAKKLFVEYDRRDYGDSSRNPAPVVVIDPFRGQSVDTVSKDGLKGAQPGAMLSKRDEWSLRQADVALFHLLNVGDARRQMIGTFSEFGFCGMGLHLPIVIVATERQIVEHPFIEAYASKVCDNLEAAVEAIRWMRIDT